jgi:hypothetical protein
MRFFISEYLFYEINDTDNAKYRIELENNSLFI